MPSVSNQITRHCLGRGMMIQFTPPFITRKTLGWIMAAEADVKGSSTVPAPCSQYDWIGGPGGRPDISLIACCAPQK